MSSRFPTEEVQRERTPPNGSKAREARNKQLRPCAALTPAAAGSNRNQPLLIPVDRGYLSKMPTNRRGNFFPSPRPGFVAGLCPLLPATPTDPWSFQATPPLPVPGEQPEKEKSLSESHEYGVHTPWGRRRCHDRLSLPKTMGCLRLRKAWIAKAPSIPPLFFPRAAPRLGRSSCRASAARTAAAARLKDLGQPKLNLSNKA